MARKSLDTIIGPVFVEELNGNVSKIGWHHVELDNQTSPVLEDDLDQLKRYFAGELTAFDLPSFSGLLLVENGTDGITKGLVTAGNKPSDTPLSYGGGVLIMAGGLPVILAEILELILGGGSE